jgi:hypothetical protein
MLKERQNKIYSLKKFANDDCDKQKVIFIYIIIYIVEYTTEK